MLRSIGPFTGHDAISCGAVGIVRVQCKCVLCPPAHRCAQTSLWVAALVLPVVSVDAGGSLLLVATTVLQFIGTVFGDKLDVWVLPLLPRPRLMPPSRSGHCLH